MPGHDGGLLTAGGARADRSPFPGLQPFTDSDEDGALFAGRDDDVELVVANLRAARLTILYGPSGAGKSSLLRAGAVRRISAQARDERAGEHAPTVLFHAEWAGDPGVALARRIAPTAAPGDDPPPLDEAIEQWCQDHKGTLLLILDQFEEYLRLHPVAGEDSLDALLPEIIDRLDLRVRILISLRDDALSELDRFEGRVPALFDNYLRLAPLTKAAAREAIVKPIARVNEWRVEAGRPAVEIEDGLVDDVLAQLADPRASSPEGAADVIEPAFLQLAMQRLWDADAGDDPPVLRRATLKDVGGAAAIVRLHLDRAMQTLTKGQQAVAEAIFGYLVTPSGAKIRWTPDDLAAPDYAKQPADEVAAVLVALSTADLRIVRRVPAPNGDPDSQGFEIFHDVLGAAVRDWARRRHEQRLERRNTRLAAAVATLLAITVGLLAYTANPGVVQDLELATVDQRFDLRGGHEPDPVIVLVGLDERSINAFERRPAGTDTRGDYAQVLANVHAGRPKAVALAFEFENPPSEGNGGEEGTVLLKRALAKAKPVIATDRIDNEGNTTMFGEQRRSRSFAGASAGYAGFPLDHDGAVRRLLAEGRQKDADGTEADQGLASLAARVARRAGARVDIDDFPALIDFAGPGGTYRHVSVIDVLDKVVRPSMFRGKIVVIGDMSPAAAGTLHPTGVGQMSDAELHANEIATMRARMTLREAPGWLTVVLVIVVSLLASALALRVRPAAAVALSVGAGLILLVAAQVSFDAGVVIAIVPPLAALVVAIVGSQLAPRGARIGGGRPGPASAH